MAGKQATGVRILSLVWFKFLPPKFGGQKAVALFNAYLAEQATLLCLCAKNNVGINTTYRVAARLPVGKKQFFNPFVWRRIYLTAKREGSTHLILEFPYHGIGAVLCKWLLRVKLIVHAHNIEYLRFKEAGYRWWRWLYYLERWTMRKADLVFFITKNDLITAQKSFGLKEENLAVVPYGVDQKNFTKGKAQAAIKKRYDIAADEKILLFAGTLDYAPNATAVVDAVEKLLPLLDKTSLRYKLIFCGRNLSKAFQYLNALHHKNLVMAGEVTDIEKYFAAADVFINPVSTGGGVQTKTIDALSYHLNAICFKSKAAGINHAANKIFAVEDGDWKGFADAVLSALQRESPTPPLFFQTHNWRTIAAEAFQKIVPADA